MHACITCNKLYKFQSSLSRHMDTHKADFKVHCQCGSTFTRADTLKRHQLKCISTTSSVASEDDCLDMTNMNNDTQIEPEASKLLEVIEPPTIPDVMKSLDLVETSNAQPIMTIENQFKMDTQTDEMPITEIPKVCHPDALVAKKLNLNPMQHTKVMR